MNRIVSKAQRGQGEVSIEFVVGHDLRRGLIEVLNRLNRVPRYPEDANEPVIDTVGGNSRAIAWFITRTGEGNSRDIQSYKDYAEEVVRTRFERVPGVARSEVYGGREREVRITFDPYRAASLGVELPAAARLTGSNQNISGGDVSVGKRRYNPAVHRRVRCRGAGGSGPGVARRSPGAAARCGRHRGRARRPQELRSLQRRAVDRGERPSRDRSERPGGDGGAQGGGSGARRRSSGAGETGLQAGLRRDRLHPSLLSRLVRNNLGLGVALAIVVLWWFLRRLRATVLWWRWRSPVSLLVAFICLDVAGRTVNIISLAGLAFAVGMTLDAAIVVLENIVRLRERGMDAGEAALTGPEQVWGALLASTATTVAIFLPIVFLEDEAGQLFADLALTIAMAVIASMVVALTVIPAASSKWLAREPLADRHARWREGVTSTIVWLTDGPARRAFWIAALIAIPLGVSLSLAPRSILGLVPVPERLAAFIPGISVGAAGELSAPRQPEPRLRVHHSSARSEHRPPRDRDGKGGGGADPALSRGSAGAEGRELFLRRVLPRRVHGGENAGRGAHRRADSGHQRDHPRVPRHHRVSRGAPRCSAASDPATPSTSTSRPATSTR